MVKGFIPPPPPTGTPRDRGRTSLQPEKTTMPPLSTSSGPLRGTLDLLILKAISLGHLHGRGVTLCIRRISGEAINVPEGSLYPALNRLEHCGLIKPEWGESENRRRAKYYRLTNAGQRRLKVETARWERFAAAIAAALGATGAAQSST